MSITLTPYFENDLCHGFTWTVLNEDLLAEQIAIIALGNSHHVQRILVGTGVKHANVNLEAAKGAIRLLTVPKDDSSHRDGWIFQCISWIAAHQATPNGIIVTPQMVHAQKGFDGMQIEIDATSNKISAVIIFEDKATVNARNTITGKVWPEFRKLEAGQRTNEVTAQVIGLLQGVPLIDRDEAIENILWKEARRYRVSVTITDTPDNSDGRKSLFAGYEQVAANPIERRRGETFLIPNLRAWMQTIADKAIAAINVKVAANV